MSSKNKPAGNPRGVVGRVGLLRRPARRIDVLRTLRRTAGLT
jgi:hypothetical protein